MGKKICTILNILLLAMINFGAIMPVQGKDNSDIRVCLSKGIYSAAFKIVEGDYQLRDMGNLLPIDDIEEGDVITVNQAGKLLLVSINGIIVPGSFAGPILAIPEDEDKLSAFSFKNTSYRDSIVISIDSGSLLVVNTLNIEHYLYGVVGKEIGYTAPEEALKAQAVVSRSFALSSTGQGQKYDVGDNTYAQVYGGYSAEKNIYGNLVIEAVDDTKGKVILYDNETTGEEEIVKAFFHSNAGGYTENSENVWNEALPYLKAVASKEDKSAEAYTNETGDAWPASCYRWEKTLSMEQINAAIAKYNIGQFQSINLYRVNRDGSTPTASGRVTRMELIGSAGKTNIYRDNIRSVFGLKSTKFDIVMKGSTNYTIKDSNDNKEQVEDIDSMMIIDGNNNLIQFNADEETCQVIGESGMSGIGQGASAVTFIGQGNGHGLGMSQWGARGMALKGDNYKEIIDHYYNQGKDDGAIRIERY